MSIGDAERAAQAGAVAETVCQCALPSWTANENLRSFLAGFLQQLEVEGSDIVNNRIAIDYILELTSGVTGRIVDACKAECQMRYAARLTYGNC